MKKLFHFKKLRMITTMFDGSIVMNDNNTIINEPYGCDSK